MSILNSLYLVGPYPWDVDDACFMFLVPCLGHIPRVWQCLIYLSYTLLGCALCIMDSHG